jgi:hypothetical protein
MYNIFKEYYYIFFIVSPMFGRWGLEQNNLVSEVTDGLSLKTRIITDSENEVRKKKRQGLKLLIILT